MPLAPEDKSADGKDKYKDYFECADAFPGVILGRICKKTAGSTKTDPAVSCEFYEVMPIFLSRALRALKRSVDAASALQPRRSAIFMGFNPSF